MITRSDALTQARVVAFAAAKFPRLGQAFYEAGPLFGVRMLTDRLDAYVAAGTLAIDDTALAARQFIDLCLGDFLKRLLFMVVTSLSQEEIGLTVDPAVDDVHEGLRRAAARLTTSTVLGRASPCLRAAASI